MFKKHLVVTFLKQRVQGQGTGEERRTTTEGECKYVQKNGDDELLSACTCVYVSRHSSSECLPVYL